MPGANQEDSQWAIGGQGPVETILAAALWDILKPFNSAACNSQEENTFHEDFVGLAIYMFDSLGLGFILHPKDES